MAPRFCGCFISFRFSVVLVLVDAGFIMSFEDFWKALGFQHFVVLMDCGAESPLQYVGVWLQEGLPSIHPESDMLFICRKPKITLCLFKPVLGKLLPKATKTNPFLRHVFCVHEQGDLLKFLVVI